MNLNEVNNDKPAGEAFKLPTIEVNWEDIGKLIKFNGEEGAISILSRDTFQEGYARELIAMYKKNNGK